MTSTQIDVKDSGYFVDNTWRETAKNEALEVHEPYSGKPFARVAAGSRADARVALDAAAKAFADRKSPRAEKAHLFLKGCRDRQASRKRDC